MRYTKRKDGVLLHSRSPTRPELGTYGDPPLAPMDARFRATNGHSQTSHSITWSASSSSSLGTARPSALAVLLLMTNSSFVGCSTGNSLGFAPLRILST